MKPPHRPTRQQPTLQRYLLRWALGAVLLVWLTLLAVAWSTGLRESRKFSDGQLVSVARLWLQTVPASQVALDPAVLNGMRHEYLQDVAVMDWLDGRLVIDSHHMADGLKLGRYSGARVCHAWCTGRQRATASGGCTPWPSVQNGHQRRVVVLMDMQKRGELGKDIAEHVAAAGLADFSAGGPVAVVGDSPGFAPAGPALQRGGGARWVLPASAGRRAPVSGIQQHGARPSTRWWTACRTRPSGSVTLPRTWRTSCARRWPP